MADTSILLMATIFLPFIIASIINIFGSTTRIRDVLVCTLPVLLIYMVYIIWLKVSKGEVISASLLTPLENMPIIFKVEPLGLIYAIIASGLWMVTSIYSIGYLRFTKDEKQTRFFIFLSISIGSAIGLAFAGNLLTMLIFYEILTLATYPLVAHKGDAESIRSGRKYLAYLLGSSIFFFIPAIIITHSLAGHVEFSRGGILDNSISPALLVTLLLLFAYGIGKAALMPLHGWLPAAMVAPTPVSALLHAVAVVKAGVFCIVKILVYVFGLSTLQKASGTEVLSYLAAGTAIAASIIAIFQDSLKKRLAYSTIAQLSYIILAASIFTIAGAAAGGMHIITHALAKITLFFAAGAIIIVSGRKYISELNGMGRKMPFVFICFFFASLSLIGIPGFAGSESKDIILSSARDAGKIWVVYVIYLGMALNAAYLLPVSYRAFWKNDEVQGHFKTPVTIVVALSITTLMVLSFSTYSHHITNILALI